MSKKSGYKKPRINDIKKHYSAGAYKRNEKIPRKVLEAWYRGEVVPVDDRYKRLEEVSEIFDGL